MRKKWPTLPGIFSRTRQKWKKKMKPVPAAGREGKSAAGWFLFAFFPLFCKNGGPRAGDRGGRSIILRRAPARRLCKGIYLGVFFFFRRRLASFEFLGGPPSFFQALGCSPPVGAGLNEKGPGPPQTPKKIFPLHELSPKKKIATKTSEQEKGGGARGV